MEYVFEFGTQEGRNALGQNLRDLRESLNYSVEQLSVTCGLSNSEIVAIEDGGDRDPGKVKRIAAALQLSRDQLELWQADIKNRSNVRA